VVRTGRKVAIAAAVLAFLGVSTVVARWLSADGSERAKVERLLKAQGRGDGAAMARELEGCDAACRARLDALAARLKGPGVVEIVRYDSHTAHALTSKTAPTRVVWQHKGELTVVQCVEVRRTGDVLTGPGVTLLRLSAPIGREAGC
jgi:hypothetical protein